MFSSVEMHDTHLLGFHELADTFGFSTQNTRKHVGRPGFPEPVARLAHTVRNGAATWSASASTRRPSSGADLHRTWFNSPQYRAQRRWSPQLAVVRGRNAVCV